MVEIDDPRPYAHMIRQVRSKGEVSAHDIAMMNVLWSMYDSLGDIDEAEFELTRDEAAEFLSDYPTTYDREHST